ncbi:acyl-CoA thioesterase [Nocardia bovistercoris]|uniref:Thioesterase family protein n=1 Tax=Nocardia bovistercoris TaxID=2785916 RepID=A0A931N1J9_9NOCA|nr:acyl-CoA thioesterase domain-containing protein [Nocardia bovistercoris]MBH0778475.1 thioesterase family protein [Nocardia bovistercoris]
MALEPSEESSVTRMLDIFDVRPAGEHRFTGDSDGGSRKVVDGTQLLAQSIVAVAKTLPDKSIRSAHAVFFRAVDADRPVEFVVEVDHSGRTVAHAEVAVRQGERKCASVSILADMPTPDVIRHHVARPEVDGFGDAIPADMPMKGRELRIVGVADVNDPDEVGPPILHAWLGYDPIPERDDLAKALLAHFTGHLSVSTTMRAHPGVGTAQAHHTISTAVMTVTVAFHEPVGWSGPLLYSHDSIQVGAGMSTVRGLVHTEEGRLIASFTQEALIRPLGEASSAIPAAARL